MSGRAYLRSFRGLIIAGVVACAVLALPTAILWAGRNQTQPVDWHQKRAENENRALLRITPRVSAGTRPTGLAPLGENFQAYIPDDAHKKGRVQTGLGWVDLKTGDLLQRVPTDLRTPEAALHARGPKGGLQEGVNILQIDREAIGRLGYDAIEKEIGADAKILSVVDDSALIVRANSKGSLASLASHPYLVAYGPYEAAYKINPFVGKTALMQRSRYESTSMDIIVSLWPDASSTDVEARLQAMVGKANVSPFTLDRTAFKIKATTAQVKKVAQDPDVRNLEEQVEYNLTNSETPTVMMIGSYFDSFMGARPFHEIGIDGGGIDTNLDGQRINDGTDAVPPQIVGVTDNGITTDAVHFSQTRSVVTDTNHPYGSTHRKIQFIQPGEDASLSSCDALLSGSNTHGNVVAGIIAGAPGDFGLTYTKAIDPQTMPPISGIPLDALARGSRILFQDVASVARCLTNELVETGGEVAPGSLTDRLNMAICPKSGGTGACNGVPGGGADIHLHVMPFGIPNFDNIVGNPQNGTYTADAAAIDQFLVNNRDFMVFSPVGNEGTIPNTFRPFWPDLFDGTQKDNDPNNPEKLQVNPPATAKNSVTVGATASDNWTVFGDTNAEDAGLNFGSKGPATGGSLRTAPLLMAVGTDGTGVFGYPLFAEAATNRSRDNDNTGDVENEIDDQNSGTSFSAGFATAAGAIVRDYFAQGFYPTATRASADRNPNVSGSLVRAALVASANFLEESGLPSDIGGRPVDERISNARAIDADVVAGDFVGVIGNMAQGYGRIVLDQVLPLPNYPPTRGIGSPDTIEYPAAGLIVYDNMATGEPVINNTTPINCQTGAGCTEKTFKVTGPNTTAKTIQVCSNNSAQACAVSTDCGTGNTCVSRQSNMIAAGQLRIALSWPDPPNVLPSEGTLINDLDLEVESPGPDNDINTPGDNILYAGNSYIDFRVGPHGGGQWSQGHGLSDVFRRDVRNTIEAVHLSSQVSPTDPTNQLLTGTWKVRVKRGGGGAIPGQISQINGPDEDANHNFRLDTGVCSNAAATICYVASQCPTGGSCLGSEDKNGNQLFDSGGQPFALVIAGPVMGDNTTPQSWGGQSHLFPQSEVKLDKYQYSCSDTLQAQVLETGATTPQTVASKVTFSVVSASGQVLDQEVGVPFTESATGSGQFTSAPLPVRLASPKVSNNGIIEGDNGQMILVSYTGSGRNTEARARFQCTPNIIQAFISTPGQTDPFSFIGGGCDRDQYLDANERVTYSIALTNFEIGNDLEDVSASLTATGPGAAAITVLDSPKNIGRLPGGQKTGVTFSLFVDGTKIPASISNRVVTLNVTLDGMARGVRTSRVNYSFQHVLNADKESLHYSTDHPGGGHEVRDYNRNLQIDTPDVLDPFKGVFFPDEDIQFSSMFIVGDSLGRITNTIGEDVNGNGQPDPGEDYNINGVLDGGILAKGTTGPSAADLVPWNFDTNNGGWHGVRHPASKPGTTGTTNNIWEYQRFGICGFQSAIKDAPADLATDWFQNNGAGIWHTGDGDPNTPATNSTACDNASYPSNNQTPPQEELIYDVLLSPVIAKVHQLPDSRGLNYGVEFQRIGFNMNIETAGDAGGSVDIDNDIDSDERNCLLCTYFYNRFPDIYGIASFNRYATPIYPGKYGSNQKTFGPTTDPDNSLANKKITGDETGFTGFIAYTDRYYRSSPITVAPANLRPFPDPGAPQVCNPQLVCSNALTQACTANADCPSGGTCQQNANHCSNSSSTVCTTDSDCPGGTCQGPCELNTVAGPERNFDEVLVDYEDGFVYMSSGPGDTEPTGIYSPGPAKNRWMIGIGFYVEEHATGSQADYGLAIDDVVLEWDETHAVDESQFVPPHLPACSRPGPSGIGAGQPCATLAVDRLDLYECNETVEVTVDDPRATTSSVTVYAVTDSDNVPFSTGVVTARLPRKQFSIPAVQGTPGLYRGRITVGSNFDSPTVLLTTPSQDITMTFFYLDPLCDGNRDGRVGEISFSNIDGDNVPADSDNCPHTYNPINPATGKQDDRDGDGVGDICDNCPDTPNGPLAAVNAGDNQRDSDADGVGDACDLDDIDFDGIVNGFDNCRDVYNPTQALLANGGALACGNSNLDRDNDGIPDSRDNCVRTANNPNTDSDKDGIGDACDGDCVNARKAILATGSCSRSSDIICTTSFCSNAPTTTCSTDAQCPGGFCNGSSPSTECPITGLCSITSSHICTSAVCKNNPTTTCTSNAQCPAGDTCTGQSPQCPNGETCKGISRETCERYGLVNDGNCSTLDDDLDRDGVADKDDNCPTIYNPAIIQANPPRQADKDNDGLGDACDPDGTQDNDNNGIPDDAITFTSNILCRKLQLAKLTVLATSTQDVNGDLDKFGDPGETVRMTVNVRNSSKNLTITGGTLVLKTVDPNIACITKSTILIPTLRPGDAIDTATLGTNFSATTPAGPGQFEYMISQGAITTNAANPAQGVFGLTLTSNEVLGVSPKIDIITLLDLDFPKVCSNLLTQPCTSNTDCLINGVQGTCENPPLFCTGDAKTLCTTTADCNLVGGVCQTAGPLFTKSPRVGGFDGQILEDFDYDLDGDGAMTIASQPFGTSGVKNDTIGVTVGTAPGGLNVLAAVGCGGFLVPPVEQPPGCFIDPDNDMDWHLHCPPPGTVDPNIKFTCANDALHTTPLGKAGRQNHTNGGVNSLHWGVHFSTTNYIKDTVKFRSIAAFMTNPINLTPFPRPGDLELSFFHIASMMDNNYYNLKPGQANDYGDVQIQVDTDTDPNRELWGNWDKLVPFENVYDHIPYIWSTFGTSPTYCDFTPVDASLFPAPGYAPRGVRETMCFPTGVWSHCGNQVDQTTIYQCDGPGSPGTERNLWVQTKFNLTRYLGQRIRVRWIAESWEFDDHNSSYTEVASWTNTTGDEGWWIDDILLNGAITTSFTPAIDPRPGTVPGCSQVSVCNTNVGDNGFNVVLTVKDESGDGIFVSGEKVTVSAASTTDPGGCNSLRDASGTLIGAGVQYKFLKDGVLVQDWSSNPTFIDNPSTDAQYSVRVRCSANPDVCLSSATDSASIQSISAYPGDGTDISLSVLYDRSGATTTTVQWAARPQPALVSGYNLFTGTINSSGDPNLFTFATPPTCLGTFAQVTPPTLIPVIVPATPPTAGKAFFYLAGHHPLAPTGQAALGRRSDGTLRPLPPACP